MKVYEYCTLELPNYKITDKELNDMGENGWKLVSESYLPQTGFAVNGLGNLSQVRFEYVYRFVKEK